MIGIKGMELPKNCASCPLVRVKGCFTIFLHQDIRDKNCPLVDLGKEDMSWEELVEKCKDLKGIYEITVFPTYITFGILFTQFYFQKNGYMVVDQNSIKKIGYSQMYQIIKSLVGDER